METMVGRIVLLLMAAVMAAATAHKLLYIAHDDLGLSLHEIQAPAMIGAALIAALVRRPA
jgi:hypothetical protein